MQRIADEHRAREEAIRRMGANSYDVTKNDLGSISESFDDVDEQDDTKKQE